MRTESLRLFMDEAECLRLHIVAAHLGINPRDAIRYVVKVAHDGLSREQKKAASAAILSTGAKKGRRA